MQLNDEQAEIVGSRARRIAVSAGAGTGKTRLLVARYLAELESARSDIPSIAAITFTDNAAAELRERIGKSIGSYVRKFGERGNLNAGAPGKLSTAPIGTIHGLAARIVRENLFDAGFPTGFEIADRNEADAIMNGAILETVLKLRRESGPASEALNALLEDESFNLDAVLKNINSIVRGSSAKHLPLPLKRPEIKNGLTAKSVKKLLEENRRVFLSTHAKKRFEKAVGKIDSDAPEPLVCGNLMEVAREMEKIGEMKSAGDEEKLAAKHISGCAAAAADALNARLTDRYLAVAGEAAGRCAEIKMQNSVADYEDLLTKALEILETNGAALSRYQKQFGLIMVDEFQDTDSLQNKIVELLCGETGNLIIVGDAMQSIYGFRGAEPEFFKNALNSPEFEHFHLPTNYRTSSKLVEFMNGFFENIFDGCKPMKAARDTAGIFETFPAEGGKADEKRENEAALIAEKISDIVKNRGYSYGDIALIFRRATNMEIYERALRRKELPFGRTRENFFALPEIRDMVSMMKFIYNPLDERAEATVLRSPFFGISDTGLARYFSEKRKIQTDSYGGFLKLLAGGGEEEPSAAARHLLSIIEETERINRSSPFETARFAAFSLGYAAGALALPGGRQIRSNIIKFTEICGQLSEKGKGLAEAAEYFDARKKDGTESAPDESDDSVTLMTGHASKGLEFPVVFLADTDYSAVRNKGRVAVSSKRGVMVCHDRCGFGTWKEIADEGGDEEEKRILYVMMTRAADIIFTQRHENPSGSSLAAIMESGLNNLPDFSGIYGEAPTAERKTQERRSGVCSEKILEKVTAENLRPVFEKEKIEEPTPKFRSVAKTEEGEIIHRFFEIWDFSPESVESAAEFAISERFVFRKSLADTIALCARNALKSPLADMARRARARHREYEFTIETEEGEIRSGKIDLLLETERGPVLVDYKYTDSFEAEKYAEQIEFYGAAIEKIWGVKPVERYVCVLPEAELKNV